MIGFLNSELTLLISMPVIFILMLLEFLYSRWTGRKYYDLRDTKYSLFLGLIFATLETICSGFCLIVLAIISHYGFKLVPTNIYIYWIVLFFLEDFIYWSMHFLDHHVRLLWAGHITHHSSNEFNLSVGLRAALFEPVEKFIFFIPLAILGFRAIDILLIYVLAQAYGAFVHTRVIKKLGILEHILITPSHHRVHHGQNIKYLDKNFGMVIVLWDKLFGTFQAEDPNEAVVYGLRKEKPYTNFFDVVTNEIRQIIKDVRQKISFKEKLKYIFGLPGYSHDGSRKTTKQLRKNKSL